MTMDSDIGAVEEAKSISVHVQRMDGDVVEVEVSSKDTVAKVKQLLFARFGIPALRQKLFCGQLILHDRALVVEHLQEGACLLQVTLVVSVPFEGVLEELIEGGFSNAVEPDSAAEAERKLTILSDAVGVPLPAHVSDWFRHLLENGICLSLLDPGYCIENPQLHSPSLLHFQEDNRNCEFAEAKHIWLLDLSTEEGSVVCYWVYEGDDFVDGPADAWQQGKVVERFSNLSEFFIARVNERKVQEERRRIMREKQSEMSQNNTCLVIDIWKGGVKEVVAIKFEEVSHRTIGDLKGMICCMKGYPTSSQRVGFKHMRFVYLDDDKVISEYPFLIGGSHVHVAIG
jgi:hypothetical protein